MFFKTPQASIVITKYAEKSINEYITIDEDVKDEDLAFIAYHISTELITNHNLLL